MPIRYYKSRFFLPTLSLSVVCFLAAGFVLSGCDRTETVFVERPFFEAPPANALGVLGYDDADSKMTVCGNCHIGQQAAWEGTVHADAWEGLQASGHAQSFCENCHTSGPLGNPTTEPSGWAGTSDARYHDVQCESCHGPGDQHVANPDAFQPVASMDIGDLSDLANATSCAECHQGSHHPFAEEWAQSKHASVVGFAAGRDDCAACHRGQGALKAWGVSDSYVEEDSPDHLAITCAVCHDPHGSANEGQLRFPVATTSIEENLCARCHDRRTIPDPGSSHGLSPHAPEAALLLGEAGWFPPGAQINQGQIVASHGSVANIRLCASCHVNSFEVTDAVTGDFVFNATGHLFTAIPCLDGDGIPLPTSDCEITAAARSFDGCATSGCHGSTQAAASALGIATARIEARAAELLDLLVQVDPNLDDDGGEIDPRNPTFTTAEGAFFNYNLATFGGDVYGSSTHNPFLTEALVVASITAVEDEYGVSTRTTMDYEQELQRILDEMPPEGSIQPIRRDGMFKPVSSRSN